MFLQTSMEANVAEFDRWSDGDGAAWQRQFEEFMANADLSFGVLGTELWSPGGLGLGRRMLRRLGRRGLLDFAGHALATCRDWTTATFALGAGARAARPVGAPHGARPRERRLRVHDPGDRLRGPARRDAGPGRRRRQARRRARRESSATRGGELRTDADVERITVSSGRATGVVLADGEAVAATRAVVAGVTPTQLYGSLLRPGDAREDVRAAAQRLPLRPRGDADPPRARRAAALEGAGRGAARPDGDRPCDARARRRLARGERGRARAAARRGDDRRRPAVRRRPVSRARRKVDRLDPAPGAPRRPRQGRRRRRARRRRRNVDGGAPRGVRRPYRRQARRVDREPLVGDAPAHRPLARRPRGD